MKNTAPAAPRVVIVGGGITGLAAATRLRELDPAVEVVLLEANDRVGGVIETVCRDGFLIERGPDNFITNVPWAVDLCRQAGLADELIGTNDRFRQAFVVRRGRLQRVPAGFLLLAPQRLWPLLVSPVLSPWGKLRLLSEYFIPPRRVAHDESLGSFARRRLGREAFERLVQPLVGGIYTADPELLSLAATLPRFLEMERVHGGLIRAQRRMRGRVPAGEDDDASGARYGLFVAPRGGFAELLAALVERLPAGTLRRETRATRLCRQADGAWMVDIAVRNGQAESLACDAVILALPAPAAAQLLTDVNAELAAAVGRIPYAGAAVVSLGYRRNQIAHRLDGFGVVVPASERRSILAVSFSSVKFPGRAPEDHVLLRTFVGGACQPELAALPDAQLLARVEDELRQLLGVSGAPLVCDIARWPASMAQYHVGHLDLVARIEALARAIPGLALAGNAYRGVGIAQCVRSGGMAAERVVAALRAPCAETGAPQT